MFLKTISPQAILSVFSRARILVSMSDGISMQFDSHKQPYEDLWAKGFDEEEVVQQYFEQLVAYVRGPDALQPQTREEMPIMEIEWRVWPEVSSTDGEFRVYSRLTVHRKETTQ